MNHVNNLLGEMLRELTEIDPLATLMSPAKLPPSVEDLQSLAKHVAFDIDDHIDRGVRDASRAYGIVPKALQGPALVVALQRHGVLPKKEKVAEAIFKILKQYYKL